MARIYTVTVFQEQPRNVPQFGARCWGYWISPAKAEQSIRENWTDIFEANYYTHALVAELVGGLCQMPTERQWFRAQYRGDKFIRAVKCQKPRFIDQKYVCGGI